MKIFKYHFFSVLLPVTMSAQTTVPIDPNCCGNLPAGTVLEIRQKISPDVINARRAAAANDYQAAGVKRVEEKVEIKARKASFLESSEFLVGASGFTIVPKGSTVTPSRGVKVLPEPPKGQKLQDWKTFQRSNPAVLRLLPITESMLNGEAWALKEISNKISVLQTGGIAYVTVLNGSPVSLPKLTSLPSE